MNARLPRSALLVLAGLLVVPSLPATGPGTSAAETEHHALVRITIRSESDQSWVDAHQAGLDIAAGRRGVYYDVVVPRIELGAFLAAAPGAELRHENLESFYAARIAGRDDRGAYRPGGAGSFGAYHTYSENLAWMDRLAADYPQVVSARWSLGSSHLGNGIWCFRVSDHPERDEDGETEVLFDGLHHAREIMAAEMPMMLAEYLAREHAAANPEIVDLLEDSEIYFVPMINPDGFLHNEETHPEGGGLWRKNRRDNGDGTFGVDLNRNYPFAWGGNWGSSGDPGHATYRGPWPGSEPEVQALMAFIDAHDIVTRQSWHSFGELTLYPWGYTDENTPDVTIFREIAAAMTMHNGYTPGQPGEVLYGVCGASLDWDYGQQDQHTKIFAFSNEMGDGRDGFWPSEARRAEIFAENLWPSLYMIRASRTVRAVSFAHAPPPFSTDGRRPREVRAFIRGFEGAPIDPASVRLHYGLNGGDFAAVPMTATGAPDEYLAAIPPQEERALVEYYLAAADIDGHSGTSPRGAPASRHRLEIGADFVHEMESACGWTAGAPADDATAGIWTCVDPVGTLAQPEDDHTVDGRACWVTGQHVAGRPIGYNDVDRGRTTLTSPVYDLTGADRVTCSYWKWYSNDQGDAAGNDWWEVLLSNDGGTSWTLLEQTTSSTNAWVEMTYDLSDYFFTPGQVQLRFVAGDLRGGSIVEAALDDVRILARFACTGTGPGAGATAEAWTAPAGPSMDLRPGGSIPCNAQAALLLRLLRPERVSLEVFDARGRRLRRLLAADLPAGEHGIAWNGRDALGRPAPGGVYFVKLASAGGKELTRRLILVR